MTITTFMSRPECEIDSTIELKRNKRKVEILELCQDKPQDQYLLTTMEYDANQPKTTNRKQLQELGYLIPEHLTKVATTMLVPLYATIFTALQKINVEIIEVTPWVFSDWSVKKQRIFLKALYKALDDVVPDTFSCALFKDQKVGAYIEYLNIPYTGETND